MNPNDITIRDFFDNPEKCGIGRSVYHFDYIPIDGLCPDGFKHRKPALIKMQDGLYLVIMITMPEEWFNGINFTGEENLSAIIKYLANA